MRLIFLSSADTLVGGYTVLPCYSGWFSFWCGVALEVLMNSFEFMYTALMLLGSDGGCAIFVALLHF